MHILSIDRFDQAQLEDLFDKVEVFRQRDFDPDGRRILARMYEGRQLCSLFYEPSTRTRLSFETAAVKLGMGVVSTENAREFSSAIKGESIEDTIRVLNEYHYDVMVLRHHETGSAARAAAVSSTPIINAGDGTGEHPTQALLDAYTIQQAHGKLDGLKVVLGGDLKHGRTARSLAKLLAKYPKNSMTFVSVPELQIGDDIKKLLRENGLTYDETEDINKAFLDADVVYWTRLQKERLKDLSVIPKGGLTIDLKAVKVLPKHAIIMHPLPRVDEIHPAVDDDPRARYFQQAGNGLYIRMALLDMVISDDSQSMMSSQLESRSQTNSYARSSRPMSVR